MAKKQFFRQLKTAEIIQYLYERGVFQSCIINSFILIVLASIVNNQYSKTFPAIKLSFISERQEDFYIEDISGIEILEEQENDPQNELIEESEETISQFASQSINNYSFIGSNIENEIINYIDENFQTSNTTISEILKIENSDLIRALIAPISSTSIIDRTISNPLNQHNTAQLFVAEEGLVGTDANQNNNSSLNEINRRLSEYGAKTGDIQVSLSWNTIDDIDLHVTLLPLRSNINWTRKVGFCGGVLDIDMNAHPNMLTTRPIENVFWENRAPKGVYIIGIHNYMPWSRNPHTDVLVVVKIKGKVHITKKIRAVYGQGIQEVARFNY